MAADTLPAIKQIHERTGFLIRQGLVERAYLESNAYDSCYDGHFFQASRARNARVKRIFNGHQYRLENDRKPLDNSQVSCHNTPCAYLHEPLENQIYPPKSRLVCVGRSLSTSNLLTPTPLSDSTRQTQSLNASRDGKSKLVSSIKVRPVGNNNLEQFLRNNSLLREKSNRIKPQWLKSQMGAPRKNVQKHPVRRTKTEGAMPSLNSLPSRALISYSSTNPTEIALTTTNTVIPDVADPTAPVPTDDLKVRKKHLKNNFILPELHIPHGVDKAGDRALQKQRSGLYRGDRCTNERLKFIKNRIEEPKFKKCQYKLEKQDELRQKQKDAVKMAVIRFYTSNN